MSILSDLIENLDMGAVALLDHGNRCVCNDTAVHILGERPKNLESLAALISEHDANARETLETALARIDADNEIRFDVHLGETQQKVGLVLGHLDKDSKTTLILFDDQQYKTFEKARNERLERLATIGQLTAGVTYELNNVLTSILGWTQIALRDPTHIERVESSLTIIDESSRRAKEIINNILTIARREEPHSRSVSLAEIADEVLRVLAWEINNSEITVIRNYLDRTKIAVDRRKLFQIFLNIVLNTLQRMQNTGGELTVSTQYSDDEALIEFHDTGHPMNKEDFERFFVPQDTTQGQRYGHHGEGGLSLALSKKIVTEIGGTIDVTSTPQTGTSLTVRFAASPEMEKQKIQSVIDTLENQAGLEILIIDSEQSIRMMLVQALEKDSVVETSNGIEALAHCRRQRFDVALIDYNMPGMSGKNLAHKIRQLCSGIKIIMLSGSSDSINSEEEGADLILSKPFDLHQLHQSIRKVCAQNSPQLPKT